MADDNDRSTDTPWMRANRKTWREEPGMILGLAGLGPAIFLTDSWQEYLLYAVLSLVIGNLLGYAIVKRRARRREA